VSDASLDAAYFERVYAYASDPWSFASSPYEAEKYSTSIGVLDRPSYARALEIGCSIGVFTARLAERCDALLAVDINESALAQARERNAGNGKIRFERRRLPGEFPGGTFDLITLCEVGYYWSDADAGAARECIARALEAGASLLLVHFLPKVDEYLRDGDDVHEAYLRDERFELVHAARRERYRVDLLRRR
jgi:SAM-dependent methyltransferase